MESISTDSLESGVVKGNYVELSSLVFEGSSVKLNLEAVAQRCSVKKVLKNFVMSLLKFTGKHLCQRLFVNLAQVFFCEFCEIFKNTFFL